MKTPREILFEHHRHIEPKLEGVRRRAVAGATGPAGAGESLGDLFGGALKRAWLELVWPSRRAWAAIATLWLVVLAGNLAMNTSDRTVPVARSAPVRELAQGLKEQRRLLTELLETTKTPSAAPTRPAPEPRSERTLTVRPC